MPKRSRPAGPLAKPVREYLELLGSLGQKAHAVRSCLRMLGRWLATRRITRPREIVPSVLLEWQKDAAARLHPMTLSTYTGTVKRFFLHLYSRGILPTNPAALLAATFRPHYLPHVFTPEDVRRILTAGLAAFKDPFTCLTAYTLFHLLYATGMRRSEALALRRSDMDLGERLLHIRRTKFHKERKIPIGARVAANLEAYLKERARRHGPLVAEDPVFVSPGHRDRPPGPMDGSIAWHLFDRMLRAVGIRPARGRVGPTSHGAPRIHSLRHSFCCHRLLKWYREGADLTHKLFLLSTYVGHRGPDRTVVYLRATEALLAEAGKRLGSFLRDVR